MDEKKRQKLLKARLEILESQARQQEDDGDRQDFKYFEPNKNYGKMRVRKFLCLDDKDAYVIEAETEDGDVYSQFIGKPNHRAGAAIQWKEVAAFVAALVDKSAKTVTYEDVFDALSEDFSKAEIFVHLSTGGRKSRDGQKTFAVYNWSTDPQ